MSKRSFTERERVAVFNAHKGKCFHCRRECTLDDMHIDHIIPESLLKSRDKLRAVLVSFGLPPDFDLNSFENWAPTHAKCNIDKSDDVFDATPLMQQVLKRARKSGEKARTLAEKAVTREAIARAESVLVQAAESGDLSHENLTRLSGKLFDAVKPKQLQFMDAITANALALKQDANFAFFGGGIHFDVGAFMKNGAVEVVVTANTRTTIKLGGSLEVDVEFLIETSNLREPRYTATIGQISMTNQLTFMKGIVEHLRDGGEMPVVKRKLLL